MLPTAQLSGMPIQPPFEVADEKVATTVATLHQDLSPELRPSMVEGVRGHLDNAAEFVLGTPTGGIDLIGFVPVIVDQKL